MSGPSNTDGLPAIPSKTTDSEIPAWQGSSTYKVTIPGWMLAKLIAVVRSVTFGTTTLASTDYYVECDSSGGTITLNPPASPVDGEEKEIIDVIGSAATNNIILGGGYGSVSGVTGRHIIVNYGSLKLKYNAALTNKWFLRP